MYIYIYIYIYTQKASLFWALISWFIYFARLTTSVMDIHVCDLGSASVGRPSCGDPLFKVLQFDVLVNFR